MVRVKPRQSGAAAGDLVGFDKESGHGSVHGAAPASRYGGLVAATHLIARTADGTGLSVHVSGDGDPLLLIPGARRRSLWRSIRSLPTSRAHIG